MERREYTRKPGAISGGGALRPGNRRETIVQDRIAQFGRGVQVDRVHDYADGTSRGSACQSVGTAREPPLQHEASREACWLIGLCPGQGVELIDRFADQRVSRMSRVVIAAPRKPRRFIVVRFVGPGSVI